MFSKESDYQFFDRAGIMEHCFPLPTEANPVIRHCGKPYFPRGGGRTF